MDSYPRWPVSARPGLSPHFDCLAVAKCYTVGISNNTFRMSTRRNYRGQKPNTPNKPNILHRTFNTMKEGTKLVMNSYLDGTDYLADKISEKLPPDLPDSKKGFHGRYGRRRGR